MDVSDRNVVLRDEIHMNVLRIREENSTIQNLEKVYQ